MTVTSKVVGTPEVTAGEGGHATAEFVPTPAVEEDIGSEAGPHAATDAALPASAVEPGDGSVDSIPDVATAEAVAVSSAGPGDGDGSGDGIVASGGLPLWRNILRGGIGRRAACRNNDM